MTAGCKTLYGSTQDASHINTIMLVKTLILYGYNCMLQIQGNLVDGNRKSVGIRSS